MSKFTDTLRDAQKYTQDEDERKSNINKEWDDLEGQFTEVYNKYREDNKMGKASADSVRQQLRDFIGRAGAEDGKWTLDDYAKGNYDESIFREYGSQAIKDLFGENGTDDFEQYLEKHGTNEQKATYKSIKQSEERWKKDPVGTYMGKALGGALISIIPGGPIGAQIGYLQDKGKKEDLKKVMNEYNKSHSDAVNSALDAFVNVDKYLANRSKVSGGADTNASTTAANTDDGTTGEEVTFTLTRGNDPNYRGFGQKLVDLGLATNKGLWGEDGDVAFYNKQLHDQGIYGNLPIGVPIKLKKRRV